MDAVFIDYNGAKKNFLWQYDKGQYFTVENFPYTSVPKVQYAIPLMDATTTGKATLNGNTLRARIPDSLLVMGKDIVAYLYIEDDNTGFTVESVYISVKPRKLPVDYTYASEYDVTEINGTIMGDNYGYATALQWSDDNTGAADRVGYFVTITTDGKIQKATSLENAHGVTVDPTGFVTNCNMDKLGSSGNLLPKYAYVCSSGFVSVLKSQGTSITDICVPTSTGMATKSSNNVGFKVIGEIDSTHILIFIDPSISVLNTSLNVTNSTLTSHINNKSNPHSVTKTQVGLSNVPNVTTNNQTPTYTAASTLSDLVSGEVLSTAFGKLSKAVTDLIAHIANKSNPHSVTKAQVGLGNCDNTSDINKPVSTAQATAIADAKKAGTNAQTTIDNHKADKENPHETTKAQVGLGNCDNTSDINKPVSTAQATSIADAKKAGTDAQTALTNHKNDKSNPHEVTKAQVGLGNCDNTSDINKPISTATQNALNAINSTLLVKADLVNGLVPLSQLPSQVKERRVVNTIADRDAIAEKFANLQVYVIDATSDSTVKSGGADYLYDGTKWIKTGESESLDVVVSWGNVTEKPTEFNPTAHNHSTSDITSGILGIERGGTGANNAEEALVNLGLTATAQELNYVDGVTSNVQTQLDSKMNSENPTGTGSLSIGRKANTTIGTKSSAVGDNVEASGYASHSEGYRTTASGNYQHVQGQYNISDTTSAHIVGNGTSNQDYSNAHTLDWSGNAWFAGDVYVGSTSGTNKDDGSKKLVKENELNAVSEQLDDMLVYVGDEDTLSWDFNTYGLECIVENEYWSYYRISDVIPTMEDCKSGVTVTNNSGAQQDLQVTYDNDIIAMYIDYSWLGVPNDIVAYIVPNDNCTSSSGLVFEKQGLYIKYGNNYKYNNIVVDGYTGFRTRKLSPIYMPMHTHTASDIGAVSQADFNELEEKVYSLEFGGGFVIIDSVTGYHYTLGMEDGKLVVILVNDNPTTE